MTVDDLYHIVHLRYILRYIRIDNLALCLALIESLLHDTRADGCHLRTVVRVDDGCHDVAANANPIRLQNPLAAQYAVMRSTLIGGLVEILQNNLNRKQNRVRVFEIARVFSKGSDGQFVQNERIGGLWYGAAMPEQWGEKTHNADFYDIKADVENLLKNKAVEFVKTEHPAQIP